MKKPILLLGAIVCLLAIIWLPLKKSFRFQPENISEEHDGENREEEEAETSGIAGQMMYWFTARAYPDPYNLNDKFMKGWQEAEALRNQQLTTRRGRLMSGMWNSIGPSANIGGRILSIAIDPTNGSKLFAGSASGGMWKSTNGGTSWSSVTTNLPVLGVTSIIIHPTGNIIYAGTGEVYRIDSTSGTPNPGNTGFAVWKTRGTYGIGILKSIDGGVTWAQVWVRSTSQLFGIQTLRFDPSDANTVYACATDGLYRSTDAGGTWTKILNLTYVSDVVINGSNIVAAVGNLGNTVKGIYKSTNGGTSWSKITLPASASGFQGYIKFGYLPSSANTIVATIGVSETASTELYRSTDFGSTWTGLGSSGHCSYQYWCAHDVAIDPSNTNHLLYAGVSTYSYTVGVGSNGAVGGGIHADVHDIQFDPTNSNIAFVCSDGGIYKSTNGGSTFNPINNGLAATQFYASIGVSKQDPNFIVGGLQDNYVYKTTNGGSTWTLVTSAVGDGSGCAVDPTNDQNVLISGDARRVYSSANRLTGLSLELGYLGGANDSRTAFASPLAISTSNPAVWYVGSDNLHKTTNSGSSWNITTPGTNYIDALHKPAITLEISPINANKLYASTSNFAQFDNDADGLWLTSTPKVLKTTTGATPFTTIMGTGANMLPDRFVMDFAISKTNDDSVFAAVGGFGTSHIYVTGDGGVNWYPKGTGLPDVPFNAVVFDPFNAKVIYAGGDLGVYVSPDRGNTWYDFNNGFWDAVQIMDLQTSADNQLIAATHGKGIFKGALFSGTLPVAIVSFTGQTIINSNRLDWKVGQEIDVAYYELERSTDGNHFQKIATIQANNSGRYKYEDAVSNTTSYYYRLKIVDIDGTYKYSDIVYLKRALKNEFHVMDNPFNNDIRLQFSLAQNSKGQINLYNAEGKLVRKESANMSSGQFTYTMNNLSVLPAGVYFVEAIVNDQRWKEKLLKK
jgi:photosystem II stability/assembly factor-like uncharacterized protein